MNLGGNNNNSSWIKEGLKSLYSCLWLHTQAFSCFSVLASTQTEMCWRRWGINICRNARQANRIIRIRAYVFTYGDTQTCFIICWHHACILKSSTQCIIRAVHIALWESVTTYKVKMSLKWNQVKAKSRVAFINS